MKPSNYIPECICLLLFTCFSCLWVISHKEDKINSEQLSPLLALEMLIPQHKVQLLNANFSDQLHYDQLAQLQSEVEALIFEVDVSDTSKQVLKNYIEASLEYTQLTSMLKTSQRLVSANPQLENSQLRSVIDDVRLKMFSYLSSTNMADKAAITELLFNIDISDKQLANWQDLQLVKLHSIFILDNYELTTSNRQKLIEMPITETIAQERALMQKQMRFITIKRFIGFFGALLALVSLSVVVINRHQNELKQNSKQHAEFAKNIMDMLGPADNVNTK